MGKLKNIFLYPVILFLLSSTGAMCPPDNEDQIKDLADLKAEVEILQRQLDEKQDQKGKLQKEIAMKDAKIKNIYKDIEEVKKRCP